MSVEHLRGDMNSEFLEQRLRMNAIEHHLEQSEERDLRNERRMDRLEIRTDRLEADVAEIKLEMKLIRTELDDLRLEMRAGFAAIQQQIMTLVTKLI